MLQIRCADFSAICDYRNVHFLEREKSKKQHCALLSSLHYYVKKKILAHIDINLCP